MCDSCRARDRNARRIKALRDSGVPVEPLPPRARSPLKLDAEKKAKKKGKKKAVDIQENTSHTPKEYDNETPTEDPVPSSTVGANEASAAPAVIFMEPFVAEQSQFHLVRFSPCAVARFC